MFKNVNVFFLLVTVSVLVIVLGAGTFAKPLKAIEADNREVLIGSSIDRTLPTVQLNKKIRLGELVVMGVPADKQDGLAIARYCRENEIYLMFWGLTRRGANEQNLERNYGKAGFDEIISAAGDYYYGRWCIGEIGGVLYWPKAYTIDRKVNSWKNLPRCETVDQAEKAYLDYCKDRLTYERDQASGGTLLNVDSSLVFKHHVAAGIDVLLLEVMPGDPHLMHSAIRGAARAFDKNWGAHIAIQAYGGMSFDELYQKRWRNSVFYSYISGAGFIYPESGHYKYLNTGRDVNLPFEHKDVRRIRDVVRETWQFAKIHRRPAGGPKVSLGIVYGKYDGTPGLWNPYAWGQYYDDKWKEGPAERGWRLVDKFYRKEDWPKETVQGDMDFSGNPPYGQYDVVPIEASLDVLQKYSSLVFLSWNTMTDEIYEKLKSYVAGGGHLVMFLPQLSTHVDRASDLKLYRGGDFSDLFGVKVTGKGQKSVAGMKCITNSSLESYRFPLWRTKTDPRFIGDYTPANVEVTTGRVISGWSDYYYVTKQEVAARPVLIENSLGKGTAFLVTAWEYPGDEGLNKFAGDILRVVLAGEQGEFRLLGSDRIRYAVYSNKAAGEPEYNVVYLLNTDPDNNSLCRLWIGGQITNEFTVGSNDLRLAYEKDGVLIIAGDKCVDINSWKVGKGKHDIEMFAARNQTVEIHNVGKSSVTVSINTAQGQCGVGEKLLLPMVKRIDPERAEFFAEDFLVEPAVDR
ncbi:hypothetical protein ACFL3G_01810 [Planctomycetota bacterium]